ncbi:MAG: hypothetical protein AAGI23_00410 [Bacteroidota bacterium]
MDTQNKSTSADFPDLHIQTTQGQQFDIPVEGSLGLLALGDIGLIAWRKKKIEFLQAQMEEQNKTK